MIPIGHSGQIICDKVRSKIQRTMPTCKHPLPVKFMVLLRPYFESNADATAFFTSADISAAHLSPIDALVPGNSSKSHDYFHK